MTKYIKNPMNSNEQMNLKEKLDWLADRYLKNDRDEIFADYLREILKVDIDGSIIPEPVRDPLTNEVRGLMVIGASQTGKSALIDRNLKHLGIFSKMDGDATGNYVFCRVPADATIKNLGQLVALATGYQVSDRVKGHEVWTIVRHRMKEFGVKLVWIDEAHHLLRPGAGRDVAGAVQALKSLLQEDTGVSVIISGVPKLEEAILKDEETALRFVTLNLFPMTEGAGEFERFQRFIQICADKLGVGMPRDPHFAERIVFAMNGELGRSIKLAKAILRQALTSGRVELTLGDAARTYKMLHKHTQAGPFDAGTWPVVKATLIELGWV